MKLLRPLAALLTACFVVASIGVGWAVGNGFRRRPGSARIGKSGERGRLPRGRVPGGIGMGFGSSARRARCWKILKSATTSRRSATGLSSRAEEGQHQFYYFVVRDPVINAFAMPGGFIAINSGLILATRNEKRAGRRDGSRDRPRDPATSRAPTHRPESCESDLHRGHAGCHSARRDRGTRFRPARWKAAFLRPKVPGFSIRSITRALLNSRPTVSASATMGAAGYDPLGMATFFDYMSHAGPEPTRVNAIQFLIDHPIFFGSGSRSERPSRTNRAHPSHGLAQLLTDFASGFGRWSGTLR